MKTVGFGIAVVMLLLATDTVSAQGGDDGMPIVIRGAESSQTAANAPQVLRGTPSAEPAPAVIEESEPSSASSGVAGDDFWYVDERGRLVSCKNVNSIYAGKRRIDCVTSQRRIN